MKKSKKKNKIPKKIIIIISIILLLIILIFHKFIYSTIRINQYNIGEKNSAIITKYIKREKNFGKNWIGKTPGEKGSYTYRYVAYSLKDKFSYGINYEMRKKDSYYISSYSKAKELFDLKEKVLTIIEKYNNIGSTKIDFKLNNSNNLSTFKYEYIIKVDKDLDKELSKTYLNNIEESRKIIFEELLNKYDTKEIKNYRKLYYGNYNNYTKKNKNDYNVSIIVILKYKDKKNIVLNYVNGTINDNKNTNSNQEMYNYLNEKTKKR